MVTGKNTRKPGEVLFLSRNDVNKILTAKDCLNRCIETFKWVGEGNVIQHNPANLHLSSQDGPYGMGVIQSFPSYIKPISVAGVKWLGAYLGNRKRGLPAITAIDIINDTETAMPLAIVDGTSVTNMRTAGHAGVGAKYLAKKNSKYVTIIGCGFEGRTHLRIMNELFEIEEVRVFDIYKEYMENFKNDMSVELGLNIRTFSSAKEAVKGADVVCMVTTSKDTVVKEKWIDPGCHVCATVGFKDLDPMCALNFDKWVVGWYGRDLEWIEGTETAMFGPEKPPYKKENIYADIATEIIPGKKAGRENDKERTVMTHMGMPALDAAVAALVYEKAVEKGIGATLKIF
jgi:alanine dehydrogenase